MDLPRAGVEGKRLRFTCRRAPNSFENRGVRPFLSTMSVFEVASIASVIFPPTSQDTETMVYGNIHTVKFTRYK